MGTFPPGPWVLSPPVINQCCCATRMAICQRQLPPAAIGAPCKAPHAPSRGSATPCPPSRLLRSAGRLPDECAPTANPRSQGLSSPEGLLHPQGLLTKVWGLGTRLEAPFLPQHGPPPPWALTTSCPALCLFHQAKDCFLNKSKKLHFLLGKFILSHFISFPPIFFPNNMIK